MTSNWHTAVAVGFPLESLVANLARQRRSRRGTRPRAVLHTVTPRHSTVSTLRSLNFGGGVRFWRSLAQKAPCPRPARALLWPAFRKRMRGRHAGYDLLRCEMVPWQTLCTVIAGADVMGWAWMAVSTPFADSGIAHVNRSY